MSKFTKAYYIGVPASIVNAISTEQFFESVILGVSVYYHACQHRFQVSIKRKYLTDVEFGITFHVTRGRMLLKRAKVATKLSVQLMQIKGINIPGNFDLLIRTKILKILIPENQNFPLRSI